MIEAHAELIDSIFVTLDTHSSQHIAHAQFWQDPDGRPPPPFQQITLADVSCGRWGPRDPSLREHCLRYTKQLEDKGRFLLTIWPDHCLHGTEGQQVVPRLAQALSAWAQARGREVQYVRKGMNDLTEMYSALAAEVRIQLDPQTQLNQGLLTQLKAAGQLLVGGQALSHCVNFTLRHLLVHWAPLRRPADIVLLVDASSSVSGCEEAGRRFVEDMQRAGVTVSTTEEVFR